MHGRGRMITVVWVGWLGFELGDWIGFCNFKMVHVGPYTSSNNLRFVKANDRP